MTVDWHFPVCEVAARYRITPERVYQLRKSYYDTRLYPLPKKLGRPPVVPSDEIREIIIETKKTLKIGTRSLSAYLNTNMGIVIGARAIHRVLLEENLTSINPSNSHKKPSWVRYEREEGLSGLAYAVCFSKLSRASRRLALKQL